MPENSPRRWLRFRLRSAIIAMTILAIFIAWRGHVERERKHLKSEVESLGGTFEFCKDGLLPSSEASRITIVNLPFLSTLEFDPNRLLAFPSLKHLRIIDIPAPDVHDIESTTQVAFDVDRFQFLGHIVATPERLQLVENRKAEIRETIVEFEREYAEGRWE